MPANSLLQGRSCNASLTMELISTAKQNILALRSEAVFGEIADAAGFPANAELPVVPIAKRKRTQRCWLTASVVNSTLSHDHVVGQQVSQRELTKRVFFHVLDSVHGELMDHRFGESTSHQAMFQAVDSLVPSSHNFLVEKSLQPLSQLLGIDQDMY